SAAAAAQDPDHNAKTEATTSAEVSPEVEIADEAPREHVHAEEAHAKAETHAANATVDAEAAAAAEEAAGAEEMSKLIDQYSEPQEAAASHEVLEVKVVAYTEHGVVVNIGGKTEGLIPAAEFA